MKKTRKKTASPHALFWQLIKDVPGYSEKYKDVIKEGLVGRHTLGRTCSLSEMYAKYPAEYSLMIEEMKGGAGKKRERYDENRDRANKRVIAAICTWLDKLEYKYPTPADKVRYAKAVACRASNCAAFNKIPLSRLEAIYGLYCSKNKVDISALALDYLMSKN